MKPKSTHIETAAIHAAKPPASASGAVIPPLELSTTFVRDADGGYPSGYVYARSDNPNRAALEARVAALEYGAAGAAFASGLAAGLAVFQALERGSHIMLTAGAYYGLLKQVREIVAPWGHEVSVVDTSDSAAIRKAWRPNTRLLWLETPNNPMLRIADIAACAELCQENGALLACDNTVASSVFQNPLRLGADLVMHSSSKYLGGHSDITGGIVIAKNNDDFFARIRQYQELGGAVPSPFDCWLLTRSIMTLPVRMRTQCDNAQRIAEFLNNAPQVERVYYPGLADHDGHAVARKQMSGFGALLSFTVRGGEAAAWRVCNALTIITMATSLGGVESLIEHRASVEDPDTSTPDNLLRLSVGLEHVDDLIDDLTHALGAAVA